MAQKKVVVTQFSGGISPYSKVGIPGSARMIRQLNIHKDPNSITLMPAPSKISSTTVTALPKWMVAGDPFDTNKYIYDASGNIYKLESDDTFTQDRTGATIGNGAAGQGLEVFDNYLYYPTATTLGRLGPLDGTPAYADDFLSDDTTDLDQSNTGGANTYTLQTSINEGATHRQTFTPEYDPVKTIEIYVSTKGTGDWTVTLHDSNDVALGSKTIANGDLSTGLTKFTFDTALRVTIGNAYHFHVTVDAGSSSIRTGTNADHEDCNYNEYFGILISDSSFHPAVEFLNFLAIGNDNYIAKWDRATYNPNYVPIRKGYKVRAFGKWEEYLVALAVPTNTIADATEGRLYYWKGTETAYDFFDDVTFGAPNCIYNQRNKLIGVYGTNGTIYLGDAPFQEVQPIPLITTDNTMEVYPGAITGWHGKTYIGVAGSTNDSTNLEQGIYEYGSKGEQLPEVLNYAFKISTGEETATDVQIGMVKGIGDELYWGWRDDSSYGIDRVKMSGNAYTSGNWESLIFDDSNPQKEKLALRVLVIFEALASGESVTPKYKVDRAASFTTGTTENTVGATSTFVDIPTASARFKEFEFGFNLASSSNTYPVVTGVFFFYDDLKDETDYS